MNATGIPPHPRHATTCATCVRLERFDRIAGQYPDSDGDGWPRQLVEHNAPDIAVAIAAGTAAIAAVRNMREAEQ